MNNQITIESTSMGAKQLKNVGLLLVKAADLGMELDTVQIGYNTTFGNTYLWSEWYSFTLFISDFEKGIKALYTCSHDGEETQRNAGNSLDRLNKWCEKLNAKSEKKWR